MIYNNSQVSFLTDTGIFIEFKKLNFVCVFLKQSVAFYDFSG